MTDKIDLGVIPVYVHGKHAEKLAYEYVDEMVDAKLAERRELGDAHPYAYTLGYTQSRLGTILSRLKYGHPEVYEEIIECYFKDD